MKPLSPDEAKLIRETMKDRCDLERHEWENCCSIVFEIYQKCRWCGAIK